MRLLSVTAALACAGLVLAQDAAQAPFASPLNAEHEAAIQQGAEQHGYTSDIARLMKIVVSSLYSDKDVWVRELLSNSNDALEKLRLLSLTDPSLLAPAPALNVSVVADAKNNRIIIRDSGIGMTKDQLTSNLGTIARSGTTEFLEALEKGKGDNLLGQFGLGFYSSFLIADRVTVASKANDSPAQYIFESEADAQSFSIAEDPRGNTLGRGTEITLWLKDDAKEYLDNDKLRSLIQRDAEYGASPIYLWTETTTTEVIEPEEKSPEVDEDGEVKVEEDAEEQKEPETREVVTAAWSLVNDRAPLWMRDPKEVSEDEYKEFFTKTFKSEDEPLAWSHFTGDVGSTRFRALVYLPSTLPNDFYSKDYLGLESLKLFVRRVFITSDLGKDYLPKHLNWVKVFIDVDDLPLNVGRDRLQKNKALAQIKKNLVKRILDLFAAVSEKDPEKYLELYSKADTALKVGVVEDTKNRDRLVKLLRFDTTASDKPTTLSEVVARRKEGQTQLFFLAGAGQKKEDLLKSPFIERIVARGYEALLLTSPMDEMIVSTVPEIEGLKFQDVAKEGLKFGDEDDEAEEEEELKTRFQPLAEYLKKQLAANVDKVVVSTRLTTSPCLVVAGKQGYSGNMERLIASQNQGGQENFMAAFAKMQKKTLEINPRAPLIEGLLEKIEDLDGDVDSREASDLAETIGVLWHTALVKSGFTIPDPNAYFNQVELLLRRSLGVSETAQAKIQIKPAPPIETGPVRPTTTAEEEDQGGKIPPMGDFANWADIKDQLKGVNLEGVDLDTPPSEFQRGVGVTGHDEL